MSILDKIDEMSGTDTRSRNITQAIDKYTGDGPSQNIEMALKNMDDYPSYNVLKKLLVDVNIADDVAIKGKYVGDLQEDIKVWNQKITGRLKYVEDYTDYSEDPDKQHGYYIALHVGVPGVEDVTITVNELAPDKNGVVVLRIDKAFPKIVVQAVKEGYKTVTKEYDLSGVSLRKTQTS